MTLSVSEVTLIERLCREIDAEASGRNRKNYINNRTRLIRLTFQKARRREKNTLL